MVIRGKFEGVQKQNNMSRSIKTITRLNANRRSNFGYYESARPMASVPMTTIGEWSVFSGERRQSRVAV